MAIHRPGLLGRIVIEHAERFGERSGPGQDGESLPPRGPGARAPQPVPAQPFGPVPAHAGTEGLPEPTRGPAVELDAEPAFEPAPEPVPGAHLLELLPPTRWQARGPARWGEPAEPRWVDELPAPPRREVSPVSPAAAPDVAAPATAAPAPAPAAQPPADGPGAAETRPAAPPSPRSALAAAAAFVAAPAPAVPASATPASTSPASAAPPRAAPAGPTPPAAPSSPPAPTAPTTPLEPAVAPAWLAQREAALASAWAEYTHARDAAQARPGQAPGWVDAALITDESGHTQSLSGRPTVFVPEPGAERPLLGWDESGPAYGPLPGRTLEFDEAVFAEHWRATEATQTGAGSTQLAALYGSEPTALWARQPALWALMGTPHVANAGPAPAGVAMADARQLALVDLYLADPLMADLRQQFGGQAEPAHSGIALEQQRLYGSARAAEMTRHSQAMASVRQQYADALAQAQAQGGPGWVEHQRSITVGDESGTRTELAWQTDESGARTPLMERVFDPDVFTAWYVQQPGLAQRAFAELYGASHTTWGRDGSGASVPQDTRYANPNWQLGGPGGLSHTALTALGLNHVPRLNDDTLVFFDLDAGWATPTANIHVHRGRLDRFMDVAVPIVFGAMAVVAVGPWIGAVGGMASPAGAAIAGAAGTAGSSLAATGSIRLKDVIKGAAVGALTAGLSQTIGTQFGVDLRAMAQGSQGAARAVATLGNASIRGVVQAAVGGSFGEGFTQGIASGLANEVMRGIQLGVASTPGLSAAEVGTLQTLARVAASAVRALASPDDPLRAAAADFLQGLVGEATAPALARHEPRPAGPGGAAAGATSRPTAVQAHELAEQLVVFGLSPDEAARQAVQTVALEQGTPRPGATPGGEAAAGADQPRVDGADPAPRVVITGQALPRDELGNRYETDSQGRQVVHLATGGMLVLGAPEAVRIVGGGAVLDMAALQRLARVPGLALGLLTMPGNLGQAGTRVINEHMVFEARPGELWGTVLERQADGSWLARPERYAGSPGGAAGFVVMSEDEIARLSAPITTPATQPQPPLPSLPVWADRPEVLPGYQAGPAAPPTPGFEPRPLLPEDLLIEQRNSQILGQNLEAAGRPRPAEGYEPHHIVPSEKWAELDDLRRQFGAWKVDLNDAANGVWLPGSQSALDSEGSYHNRLHNSDYRRAVERAFEGVASREDALEVLDRIRGQLEAGTFPGSRPRLPRPSQNQPGP
jgi:hypothetical protein